MVMGVYEFTLKALTQHFSGFLVHNLKVVWVPFYKAVVSFTLQHNHLKHLNMETQLLYSIFSPTYVFSSFIQGQLAL